MDGLVEKLVLGMGPVGITVLLMWYLVKRSDKRYDEKCTASDANQKSMTDQFVDTIKEHAGILVKVQSESTSAIRGITDEVSKVAEMTKESAKILMEFKSKEETFRCKAPPKRGAPRKAT